METPEHGEQFVDTQDRHRAPDSLITPQWLQEEVNTGPRPLGNTLSNDWRAILPVVKGPC
jgi:hypothetical protein